MTMRRLILPLALLLLAAPAAAQDTLSLRELRQRTGYAIDRQENLIDEATAALDHLRTLWDAIDLRVRMDSLAALDPDTAATDTAAAPVDTATAPVTDPGEPYARADFEYLAHDEQVQGSTDETGNLSWKVGAGRGDTVHATSGTRSLRHIYPANNNSNREFAFELADPIGPEIWIQYDLRLADNWKHRNDPTGPDNNKFLAMWAENYSTGGEAQFILCWHRSSDTESHLEICNFHGDDDRYAGGPHANEGTIFTDADRGRWMQIRVHVLLDESGMIELWKDGTLVASLYDYNSWTSGGLNYFRNGYIMGAANSGFDEETPFWIDDLRIYDTDPGW